MFDSLTPPFDTIANGTLILSALLFAASYAWTQIKSGKANADANTIATYKSEIGALTLKVNRIEQDNKTLTAEINKLIGENNSLKEFNSLRDPSFATTFKSILDEIKQIRIDFRNHADLDDKRFTEILNEVKK
jgi:septal ring factor EnvC (AmiA/AmiB activator)